MPCQAKNAANAAKSTVNSNMIGKNAGTVQKFQGFPCTSSGYRPHDGPNSTRAAVSNPETPPNKTHPLVHSMDGKRRVNVPAPEPSIADTLGRFIKSSSARVLRPHGINFVAVRSLDHRVRSFPPGETGRTSGGSP